MNRIQTAAKQIADAVRLFQSAKRKLLAARNDQHVPLAVQLAVLEEIHSILTDPECTPEIAEGGET